MLVLPAAAAAVEGVNAVHHAPLLPPSEHVVGTPPDARRPRRSAAPQAQGSAGGAPLFAGPRDMRATLRKHMRVVHGEGDGMLGKRARGSQARRPRAPLLRTLWPDGIAGRTGLRAWHGVFGKQLLPRRALARSGKRVCEPVRQCAGRAECATGNHTVPCMAAKGGDGRRVFSERCLEAASLTPWFRV